VSLALLVIWISIANGANWLKHRQYEQMTRFTDRCGGDRCYGRFDRGSWLGLKSEPAEIENLPKPAQIPLP
jgi:hypothetical protein